MKPDEEITHPISGGIYKLGEDDLVLVSGDHRANRPELLINITRVKGAWSTKNYTLSDCTKENFVFNLNEVARNALSQDDS